MKLITISLGIFSLFTACSNTFYIVRHAEKEVASAGTTMSTAGDPDLSEAGMRRAVLLKEELKTKHISYIFSTQTRRTLSTAEPLREFSGLGVNPYNSDTLQNFIARLKATKKGNVLIVGHSNTVDDIVNKLSGETKIAGDLKDSEYDNLFVVKRRGNKYRFTRKHYGDHTN